MIMKITLGQFNISNSVFLDKLSRDLEVGVRVKSGTGDNRDIVRVWTDTKGWQFSLYGIVIHEELIKPEKVEISSFGDSIKYLKLNMVKVNVEISIDMQKLSPNFAELSTVEEDEARDFLEGYMNSTVNRTLTEKLFEDFSKDKDQNIWLEQ